MGKSIKKKRIQKQALAQDLDSILSEHRNKKMILKRGMSFETFMKNFCSRELEYFLNNYKSEFIRDPNEWKVTKKSLASVEKDLLDYCFVKFKYPKFMIYFLKVFKKSYRIYEREKEYINIFLAHASGKSLYKEYFKILGLTKKETFIFLNAPDFITTSDEALMYSIIKSELGDEALSKRFFDVFKKDNLELNCSNYITFGGKLSNEIKILLNSSSDKILIISRLILDRS